jgi:hypothetical protein
LKVVNAGCYPLVRALQCVASLALRTQGLEDHTNRRRSTSRLSPVSSVGWISPHQVQTPP